MTFLGKGTRGAREDNASDSDLVIVAEVRVSGFLSLPSSPSLVPSLDFGPSLPVEETSLGEAIPYSPSPSTSSTGAFSSSLTKMTSAFSASEISSVLA